MKAEDVELRKEQKRKMLESGSMSGKKKYSAMSARYLEDGADDEGQFDSTSLANLKRSESKKRTGHGYGSSGEDSGEENRDRRFQRARREKEDPDGEMDDFIVNEEDEQGSDKYEEEADFLHKSRIKKKSTEVF